VPAAVAAALEAVRICRSPEGPELFGRVLENARYLHGGLRDLGYQVVEPTPIPGGEPLITPIVPVVIGDDLSTAQLWKALWEEGLYTNVALYPAVPPGGSLIRTSVMATHEQAHLDAALEIFERVKGMSAP
jgi:8-amino-7-oxononanoate synthase